MKITEIDDGSPQSAEEKTYDQEWPYSYVLSNSLKTQYCSYCFQSPDKLRRCGNCRFAHFCNKDCQRLGWPEHNQECVALTRVHPNVPTEMARLIARIIWRQKRDPGPVSEPNERRFEHLMTHRAELEMDPIRMEHFQVLCLVLNSYLGERCMAPVTELLDIFGRICVNAFSILNEDLNPIGTGLYIRLSILDHSCDPNAAVVFDGPKAIVRKVDGTVMEGDLSGVRINYIDLLSSNDEREQQLKEQYYFKCDCEKCLDHNQNAHMLSLKCSDNSCTGYGLRTQNEEIAKCSRCGREFECGDADVLMQRTKWELERMERSHKEQEFSNIFAEGTDLLKDLEKKLSSVNIYRIRLLDRLLDAAIELERWKEAREFCSQTLDAYRRFYPEFHPNLALQLMKYAKLVNLLGPMQDVLSAVNEAQDVLSHSHGPQHPLYLKCEKMARDLNAETNFISQSALTE